MGWAVANLALSAYEFKETHVMFGQWGHALRNIGWGVDWLVKAHITASDTPTANVFVGQVGAAGCISIVACVFVWSVCKTPSMNDCTI